MPQIKQGLPGKPITSFGSEDRLNLPNVETLGKYDVNYYPELNQEHNRADNQTWLRQITNGLVSRGLSIAPKIGAGIGSVGGAVAAIFNGDASTIWDNPINNWFNSLDEDLRDMAPVYKSRKYAEGDLLSKMMTTGFWADDAFDGIAFALSAAVPGIGLGKATSGVGAALKSTDLGRKIVKGLSKIGANSHRANLLASTAYNTISESAAEAYQTQKEIEVLYKEKGLSEAEAKQKAAEAAAQTFWANTAVLAVPNFVQSTLFHGGWDNVSKSIRESIWSNKGIYDATKNKSELWGTLGKSIASEGLWEENVQQGIQNYERELALGLGKDKGLVSSVASNMALNVKGFVKSFLPGVTTDSLENEGAVSIFLGGLIGSGSAVFGHLRDEKTKKKTIDLEQKRYADLFTGSVGKAALSLFQDNVSSIYKTKGTKKVSQGDTEVEMRDFEIDDNGKLVMDTDALINLTAGQLRNKELWNSHMVGAYRNDPMMLEYNNKMALAALAHDLHSKGYSKEEATSYLNSLSTVGTEEAKQTGVDSFIADNIQTAIKYFDTLDSIKTRSSDKDDFEKDPKNFKFKSFWNKLNYYLQVKQDALESMSKNAPNNDTIHNLLQDNAELIQLVNQSPEKLKKEYESVVDDIDNHLSVIGRLKDKKNLTTEEQSSLNRALYKAQEHRAIEGDYGLSDNVVSSLAAGSSAHKLTKIAPGMKDEMDLSIGRSALAITDAENQLEVGEDPVKIANNLASNLISEEPDLINRVKDRLDEELSSLYEQLSSKEDAVRFSNDDLQFHTSDPEDTVGSEISDDRLSQMEHILSPFNVTRDTLVKDVPSAEISKFAAEDLRNSLPELVSRIRAIEAAHNRLDELPNTIAEKEKLENEYYAATDKIKFLKKLYFDKSVKERVESLIKRFKNDPDKFDDIAEVRSVLSLLEQAKEGVDDPTSLAYVQDSLNTIQTEIFPAILDVISKQGAAQIQSNLNLTNTLMELEIVKEHNLTEVIRLAASSNLDSLDGILIALQSLRGNVKAEESLMRQLDATLLEYESFLKTVDLEKHMPYSSFVKHKYYVQYPDVYLDIVLRGELFASNYNDPNSRLFQFRFDKDLDRLIADLPATKEFTPAQKSALTKIWQFHNTITAISLVNDILKSDVNFSQLLDKKKEVIGDVAPSLQQNIVLNQLATFLHSDTNKWALVKGIGGSGKTFLVARLLNKLVPSSIYAFSKTQKTSDNINRAVFGNNHPNSSFEKFMNMSDLELSKVDLLIIDEAFTFTNVEIQSIQEKVNIFKTNNPKSKLKVIAMGDPSQTTAESDPILTSTAFPNIIHTLPLTSTYRTNVGPISSVSSRFKLTNENITDAFGQSNKSVEDLLKEGTAGAVGVVVTENDNEIIELLKTPSSRSRVLIVATEADKAGLSGLKVDIETPLSAQGYQWDEVFILMDKALLGNNNFQINKGVYTALSRAKSLIVTSHNLGIKGSLPNQSLVSSSDESSEQIEQARQLFNEVIEGAERVRKALQGNVSLPTLPEIVEEKSEAAGSEDIAAPTAYTAIINEPDQTIPVFNKSDDFEQVHSLAFPSNYILSGTPKVAINSKAHIIRVSGPSGNSMYAVVSNTSEDNFVLLGYLGDHDFKENDYFSKVINEKPNVKLSYINVDKTANGFKISNIDALSLGQVAINDYRNFKTIYGDTYTNTNTPIEDAIIKFYNSYFGVSKSGRRISPIEVENGSDGEWVRNGKVNWNVVKDKISVQIFTEKNPPKDGTKVFYGLPYLVVKDPRQSGGEVISKSIYIALDAAPLNSKSYYYTQVKKLFDVLSEIYTISNDLELGKTFLQESVESHVHNNYQVVSTNDVLSDKTLSIQKNPTVVPLSHTLPDLGISPDQYTRLEELFDELVPMVYGIELKTTYFNTEEEAQEKVGQVIDGKKIVAVEQSKNKKFYLKYQKDAVDDITAVFQQYAIRSGQGTAQKALNAIAMANQSVGDVNIRIRQFVKSNGLERQQLTSHSILSAKEFIDYYRLYQDFPQWGKNVSSFESVNHLLNWVEKNPDKAGISKTDLQKLINTKYKTLPYNLATLYDMTTLDDNGNSPYLREPLRVGNLQPTSKNFEPGVNYKGSNLHVQENRDYLNSVLRSKFSKVRQTYIDVRLPKGEEALKKEKSSTVYLKDILKPTGTFLDVLMEKFLKNSDIKVIKKGISELRGNAGAATVWNGKEFEIHVNFNYDTNDLNLISVLVHEGIHALTTGAIHAVDTGTATKEEIEFVQEITALQKRFNAVIARRGIKRSDVYQTTLAPLSNTEKKALAKKLKKDVSELTKEELLKVTASKINLNEFIANLSNPKFYELASQIEVKPKKSILNAFIDALLKLFGMGPESSIYDTMVASLSKLLKSIPAKPEVLVADHSKLLSDLKIQFNVELEDSLEYGEENDVYIKYSKVFNSDGSTTDYFNNLSESDKVELINSLLVNLDSSDIITYYALKDTPKEGLLSTGGAILESHYLNSLIEDKLFISPNSDPYAYNLIYTILHQELFDPYSRVLENIIKNKDDKVQLMNFLFENILSYQDKRLLEEISNSSDMQDIKEDFEERWDEIPLANSITKAVSILSDHIDDLSFIINSIQDNSVEAYKEAKLFVINEIYRRMKPSEGLVRTKDEVIKSIIDSLRNTTSEGIVRVEKRTLLNLTNRYQLEPSDELQHRISKQRSRIFALQSLLSRNKSTGNLLVFDVIADIYPKYSAEDIDELLLYADDIEGEITRDDEELQASKGISMHIKEHNKSYELSISDSLKNLLCFIRVGDRFVNSSVAYYKTLQWLSDFDTTQGLDKLVAQLRDTNSKDALSLDDKAIINNLIDTISTAIDDVDHNFPTGRLPKQTAIVSSTLPNGATIYYGAFTELDIDISNYSYEQAKLANDIHLSPPFGNTSQLYSWLKSRNSEISEYTFNKMFAKLEALNSIRELYNGMASMKETELYIATRSPRNKNKISLIRSKAAGVSFRVKEELISRIEYIHETHGIDKFDDLFKSTYPKAKAKMSSPNISERIDGIKDFFKFMGMSYIVNNLTITESDVSELVNAINSGFIKATNITIKEEFESETDEFQEWLDNVDGYITRFSDILSKGSTFVRNPSVRNAKGDKFFKFHESSWAYDTLNNLIKIDSSTRKFSGSKGDSKFRRVPEWIDTTLYRNNIFVSGHNKLYSMGEFEGALNSDNNSVTPYQRQNKYFFFQNYFLQFFLDGVRQYNDKYFQPVYIPSDKPKHTLVRINVLNDTGEILNGIKAVLQQALDRRTHSLSVKNLSASISNDEFRNFKIVSEAMKELNKDLTISTLDEIANKAHEILGRKSNAALDEFMKLEIPFDIGRTGSIFSKLSDKVNPGLPLGNKKGDFFSKKRTDGVSTYTVQKADIAGAFDLFFKNHYINSYFLNQLIAGDAAFYKSSDDIVKRYAGVFAPGVRGLVHPEIGMREHFHVLTLKDTVVPHETTKDRIRRILFGDVTASPMDEQELDNLLEFFDKNGYDVTDAQGFMTSKRFFEIQRGFGRAWGTGYVMKPVHFEIVKSGDETYSTGVPTYLKYSSIVLEKSLIEKFPSLARLAHKLEDLDVDELIFNSGVKVGIPITESSLTLRELLDSDAEGLRLPIMKLSNNSFRLQFNPAGDPNSEVAIFTQLMYFLNIFESTKDKANEAYKTVAELIKDGREKFASRVSTPSKFKEFLSSTFKGPGSERALDLLMAGVSVNFPLLEKKAIVALASGLESSAIKTKFKGGSLVLQTPEGAELLGVDGIPKELSYTTEIVNGRKILVAEAIVPKSLLTEEHLRAIENGNMLFASGDAMAFRIPSTELHSALTLKIVGTYSDTNTNVIIAPKEVVPIHGSDFDVDKLFVITRELISSSDSQLVDPKFLVEYSDLIQAISNKFFDDREKINVFHLQDKFSNIFEETTLNQEEIESKFLSSNISDKAVFGAKNGLAFNRGKWSITNKILYNYTQLVDLAEEIGLPNVELKNYTPLAELHNTPVGYIKRDGVYVLDNEFESYIIDIKNQYLKIKENTPSEIKKILLPKLDKELERANSIINKYRRNKITETMLTTINSTELNSMIRMLSPISFDKLWASIEKLNLPKVNLDLSDVSDSYKAYQSLSDGQILTGAFANAVKVFAYLKRAGSEELANMKNRINDINNLLVAIKDAPLPEEEIEKLKLERDTLIKMSSKPRSIIDEPAFVRSEYALALKINGEDKYLNRFVDIDILGENKTTEIFDALINAAIDNLKLGLLPKMHINLSTGSAVVGMTSLGVPIDYVTLILHQPVLASLSSGTVNNIQRDWIPAMKALIDNNEELLSDYVLNKEDLENGIGGTFDMQSVITNPQQFKVQLAVANFFLKGYKVGEDMRNMASFMNIIRALPVFIEKIESLELSLHNNIGKIDDEGVLQLRNDFSLIVPNTLLQNPHIAEAYNTFLTLRKLISSNFTLHSPEIEKFIKDYSTNSLLESNAEIDNSAKAIVSQKRSLISYLLGEIIYNDISSVKPKQREVNGIKFTLSPSRVFSERVASDIEAIKKFAESEDNAFLQNIYVYTNDSYVKSIKFGGGNNLNSTDIARITLGFNALNKYEVENGKVKLRRVGNAFELSPIQKDLLNYAILNYGMEFSTSNYSNYIKTSMIKDVDTRLNNRLKEIINSDPEELSNLVGPHFFLTHIVQQWQRLPFIEDSLRVAIEFENVQGDKVIIRNGIDSGVYYDRKYSNIQGGREIIHPLFMKVAHNRGADIYVQVHKTDTATYYQKVGKSSDTLFSKPKVSKYNLKDYFDPRELTIAALTVSDTLVTSTSDWNIEPGTEFWATPIYNYDRTERVRFRLKSKSKNGKTVNYTVEKIDYNPNTEVPQIDMPIVTEPPTLYAVYNGESLKADIERDDATGIYKDKKGNEFDSVTGKLIPSMQENPLSFEGTVGDRAAERVWKNRPAEDKIWVSEVRGEVNKMEYKFIIDEKYNKGKAKGDIFHKYIHYYINRDPETLKEIQALMVENNFTEGEFEWITKDKAVEKIINKTGTDYLSSNNPIDRLFTELPIKSSQLRAAGTVDLLIDHGDNIYSLFDFKTGAAFNRTFESSIFKYASTSTEDIWDNPRNRAKLQLMWYALMIKTENPDAKFKSLEIQYIRNKNYIDAVDNRKYINAPAYLEMIENFLKNERPEIYSSLSSLPHFKELFSPATYNYVPSQSMNLTGLNSDIAMELKLKMLKLQGLVMWDKDLTTWKSKTDQSKKVFEEIEQTIKEITTLQNTPGVSYASWDTDMSWMESWVGSASSSTNPFVQLYYKFLQTQKNKAAAETTAWESQFNSLLTQLRAEANSKDILGKITRNFLGGDRSDKLYGFAYIKDELGELRFLTPEKDPSEWEKLTSIQKKFLLFVLETSDKYFINDKSNYIDPRSGKKVSLANKVITTREVRGANKNLTNLDLFNRVGTRTEKSTPFFYKRGFVFKVPPLLEDISRNNPFLSKKFLSFVWNKYFTNFFEANFDGWFSTDEAIPMKYLGNDEVNDNMNYSLNIEYMMKNVVKQYNYKLHLDEVYALGKGLQYYLMAKEDPDSNTTFQRSIDWFEDSINLHLLGRKQTDIEMVRRAFSIRGVEGKLLQFNFVKFLRSLKQFFAGPTMWLQPVSGLANAVFAGLVTMKEAIRNEFSIYGKHANFGVSDIAYGMRKAISMYTLGAADGSFREDPIWLLMEKVRFLPDNYDWFTSSAELLTGRNKAFTSKTLYMFHSYPEEVLSTATFIAQLRSMKLDDGSSMLDHYKVVDKIDALGNSYKDVEWDGTVRGKRNVSGVSDRVQLEDVTELTQEEIDNLKYLYEKMHGGYRQDERIRAEYYIWGELMFQFKRYMPSILRNLFASKGLRTTQGYFKEEIDENGNKILKWTPQIIEGRFVMLAKLILNYTGMLAGGDKNVIRKFLNMQKDESYDWENLSDAQKDDLKDFAVTFSMFLLLMLGYFKLWDRNEDNSMKRLQLRIANDFAGNSYLIEVLQNIVNLSSPVVAKKSLQYASGLGELSLSIMFLGIGDEENAFTKEGDLRGLNNVIRNTHILSSIYNVNRFINEYPEEIEWNK